MLRKCLLSILFYSMAPVKYYYKVKYQIRQKQIEKYKILHNNQKNMQNHFRNLLYLYNFINDKIYLY